MEVLKSLFLNDVEVMVFSGGGAGRRERRRGAGMRELEGKGIREREGGKREREGGDHER